MSAIEGLQEILEYLFYNHFGALVVAIAIILLALTIQSVWHKPGELPPEVTALLKEIARSRENSPEIESPSVEEAPGHETKAPVEDVMEEVTHHGK